MFRRACFVLALGTLTPQEAYADCWVGESVRAFQFLWSATVQDVQDCLRRGFGPNERASDGFPPLYTMANIGTKNPEGLAVIRALVRAGGNPNIGPYPYRFKKSVTALYIAKKRWGEDSDVVRALRGEAPRTAMAVPSGGALFGAIAVGELRYLDEGERYRIPSVISYDASSIDDAVRNAKNACNKRYPSVKLEPGVNECFVYLIFSSSFSAKGVHDGKYHTSPGRCGAAMKWRVTYHDGSETTFFNVGAGRSNKQARSEACRQYRDNQGGVCSDLSLSVEKCNSR